MPSWTTDAPSLAVADLLSHMVEVRGSDLFLKAGAAPRIRVGGALEPTVFDVSDPLEVDVVIRALVPDRRADELDASGATDFALALPGVGRFRVHVYRQRGTLAAVFRRVMPGVPSWTALGLPPVVDRLGAEGGGLVLVTGPAGSGRTTTVSALVDHINEERAAHIVTIEDPIEVLHVDKRALVSQREVGSDTPSVREGLARAVRQAPDVLVVGDLVDRDTAQAVLDAAATGQLVIATLAASSTVDAVQRVLDLFPPTAQRGARHQVAASLRAATSQRLLDRADGRGSVAALEVLLRTPKIEECLRDEELSDLAQTVVDGRYYGMQSLDQALVGLCRDGLVSVGDALRAATDVEDLQLELQACGLAVSS